MAPLTRALSLGFCLACLPAFAARAETTLCLEVVADSEHQPGLERLAADELGRHPSHQLVTEACASRLRVELFQLAGRHYLTVRANQSVPLRHDLERLDDLGARLSDAISQALGRDPVYLAEDPSRYSAAERAVHSVLRRGQNTYRLELFQTVVRSGQGPSFAAGGALSFARGAGHWSVFARLYAAGWLSEPGPDERALRVMSGADAGLTYEFFERTSASLYVSAGLGLQYLRFEGRLRPAERDSVVPLDKFLPAAFARFGLRCLRTFDFDMDVFVMGTFPMGLTYDPDVSLEGFYTPALQAGLGVGF